MTKGPRSFHVRFLPGMVIAFVVAGCVSPTPLPDNTTTVEETEPNDSFFSAQAVPLAAGQPVNIEGTFGGGMDLDVYALGTRSVGETISVQLSGSDLSSADATIALFDQDQNVAIEDDGTGSDSLQSVTLTVRKAGTYYLVLSEGSSFNSRSVTYAALVEVGSAAIPVPARQVVFLDYRGAARVDIGGEVFISVEPFSDLDFGSRTQTIAGRITDRVRSDYEGLNIEFRSSFDGPEPDGPHSVVFVSGGRGDGIYGLADDIDWYNENPADRAITFLGSFRSADLTDSEFVDGAANIISHELGHLVGLVHTDDHTELMDIQTPLRLLVRPQDFHRAPLASSEFPIGFEDCLELLQFSLGIL